MQRLSQKFTSLPFTRLLSTGSPLNLPIKLSHRQLVDVKGPDGCGFLQGLVTADVVSPTRVVQYGLFLNTQGRVLYDVLFYHMGNERLWLECSEDISEDLIKHLKKYVLRSKVTISHVTDVDVCFDMPGEEKYDGALIRASDPRSSSLGNRLLVKSGSSQTTCDSCDDYHRHRISIGIPEGTEELPPSKCLPFEVNMDLMQGVSFSKGCYIGQELTSRAYHTGVLRKRLFPLIMSRSIPSGSIPWGTKVVASNSNKVIGKVLAHREQFLLAILRLQSDIEKGQTYNAQIMSPDGALVDVDYHKPDWWPD